MQKEGKLDLNCTSDKIADSWNFYISIFRTWWDLDEKKEDKWNFPNEFPPSPALRQLILRDPYKYSAVYTTTEPHGH